MSSSQLAKASRRRRPKASAAAKKQPAARIVTVSFNPDGFINVVPQGVAPDEIPILLRRAANRAEKLLLKDKDEA